MQDRHEYHMHTHRIEPVRQHYHEANAIRPSDIAWVVAKTVIKLTALVSLIGLAGGVTGCGGGGSDAVELQPALAPDKCATLYKIREMVQLAAWEAHCNGVPMTWIRA